MRQRGMEGLVVALAAGLLLVGVQAGAQPRRGTVIQPRAATGAGMLRQRATPGRFLGAGRPYASTRYRSIRRAAFPRPHLRRFRHYYDAPYTYYYYAPPPAYYYYGPPVAYYYGPPSGYYYTSTHGRRRHHRYRYRVAGYRGYYTARVRRGGHHKR